MKIFYAVFLGLLAFKNVSIPPGQPPIKETLNKKGKLTLTLPRVTSHAMGEKIKSSYKIKPTATKTLKEKDSLESH